MHNTHMNYRSFYQKLLADMHRLGLEVETLEPNELMRCKTTGDRGHERSGWYVLFDDADLQVCVFGDWRTGSRQQLTSKQALSPVERQQVQERLRQAHHKREQAQRRQWERNAERLNRLWANSLPIDGNTPITRYLSSRGIIAPPSEVLRWANLTYWHDGQPIGNYPTMLGAITNPDGGLVSIHRTYLTQGGAKADVPTGKKLMPACGALAGASIMLHPPKPIQDGTKQVLGLGIAEGIETALSAHSLFDVPVWACISAHGIKTFTPPRHIKNIYIFADNDANGVGQEAANHAAERLTRLGHVVRIHTPPRVGTDWNDTLIEQVK